VNKKNGIVLKTFFSKKMKMIILDEDLGKIEAISPSDSIPCGALIAYYRQQKGHLNLLQEYDLIDVPMGIAQDDILFLHHILEVCYFSVPFGSSNVEIFELLLLLFKYNITDQSSLFKIAFLFKLLILLGMHPDEPHFQKPYYYFLARESIDTIMNKSIHLNIKPVLHEWIRCCLRIHPLAHSFRTIHFLDTDRLLL
jgi:hypothetical protein